MPVSGKGLSEIEKFWLAEFQNDSRLQRVHSIGAVRTDQGNQMVQVFFVAEGSSRRVPKDLRVGLLPKLKPGTTWRQGRMVEEVDSTSDIQRLALRHVVGPGTLVDAYACRDLLSRRDFFPPDVYWRGWFLRTSAECLLGQEWRRCTLLIPCPVVFVGYYAIGGVIAQMLLQFPGRLKRFRAAPNSEAGPAKLPYPATFWRRRFWFVGPSLSAPRSYRDRKNCSARICLNRTVPLYARAHVTLWYLSRHARKEAMSISLRLSRDTDADRDKSAHIAVYLPFRKPSLLDGSGLVDEHQGNVTVLLSQIHYYAEEEAPKIKVHWEKLGSLKIKAEEAEGPLKDRDPGPPQFAPASGGGSVSSTAQPKANQFAAPWFAKAAGFGCNYSFTEAERPAPKVKAPPRPRPGGQAPKGFAVGEGSHSRTALPPAEVVPQKEKDVKETPSEEEAERRMDVVELPETAGDFGHITEALKMLREALYEVSPLDQGGEWIYERDQRGGEKGLKIFAARILHAEGTTCLLEMAHRFDEAGEASLRWSARTSTILVTPTEEGKTLSTLGGLLKEGWQNVNGLAALLGEGWSLTAVRHPPRRGAYSKSAAGRAALHFNSLVDQLGDPPPPMMP